MSTADVTSFVRDRVGLVAGALTAVSLALVFGAVGGVVPRSAIPRAPDLVIEGIPHVNALLSVLAIGSIGHGLGQIRRGRVDRHRRAMLVALALFASFLLLYLYRVAVHGPTAFGGPDVLYSWLYLPLLGLHMALAILCIPLLYYVLLLAVTRPPSELSATLHPRIGRIAAPLWLVSFVMGVAVYVLLYWAF
ncbi:MAG: DUF420 domain-containing protein [Haloarculaceae archaeon]